MPTLSLKPTHKAVTNYYESLKAFDNLGIKHETAVRSAFQTLLEICGREFSWKLVPEYGFKGKGGKRCSADGALIDVFGLRHGVWEAKDADDKLEKEIKAKFEKGYPKDNILFQEPRRAILYQQGQFVHEADLTKPEELVHILQLFLTFAPPALAEWEKAVADFKDRIPALGETLRKLIEDERQTNKKFITAFTGFSELCRNSLNPNLTDAAIEEMIIQHLLTERIFRKIFDFADFSQRNVIAQEIEKVAAALASKSWSRDEFVKAAAPFYKAIEDAAGTLDDFAEKQTFLNTVYERFFQGFCVKVADTHGIVYTPQSPVDFMVASVEHVLNEEFDKSLTDSNVHILDPFTGTGNFIVNIMRFIAAKKKSALPHKYREELHCNEVMLLPYYVASMNIEHTYYEATGESVPFEGVCLVDTFRTLEPPQQEFGFISEKNSARVEKQKKAPIRVVIANPPYNAWQADENDNNRNTKYGHIEQRVKDTYGKASNAQNKNSLSDPYIKAFRYASDKVKDNGIIAYISNGAFVDSLACDGMRKRLAEEFDAIYVLDLGGNVRKNPKLSGTTHNVFGIQVGVCITLLVKRPGKPAGAKRSAKIYYHATPTDWRREAKYRFLADKVSVAGIEWEQLTPDKKQNWIARSNQNEFDAFMSLADRDAKPGISDPPVFDHYSRGIATSRDDTAVDFSAERLKKKMSTMIDAFNAQVDAYHRLKKKPAKVEEFIDYESGKIAWSRDLKSDLLRHRKAAFAEAKIRPELYRPFAASWLFFDRVMNEEVYGFPEIFPKLATKNLCLCVTDIGSEKPFMVLATDRIADLHLVGAGASTQCFPHFAYSEDGKERRDNITDGALKLFTLFYDNRAIKRDDIFHYVYAMLHHPQYRERYAENLKRDLPRIPFAGVPCSPPVRASGEERSHDRATMKGAKDTPEDTAKFFPLSTAQKAWSDGGSPSHEGGPPSLHTQPEHNPAASYALFKQFVAAGKKLAALHVNYEEAEEYMLARIENSDVKLNLRVEAMKLSKDKTSIIYNEFLTLYGIPPEVFDYRLGNRSALEWVIDQYRVSRDENDKIVSDPNRMDDEEYIIRLIGQVVTVSMETLKTVKQLPEVVFA